MMREEESKLSHRQQRIRQFIERFMADRGYPPTIRDIQSGCGISSTSVVDYNLNILEREGYLRRHPEISRGIEVTGLSGAAVVPVPLLGLIAAGEPIPVPSADTWNATAIDNIEVPAQLTGGYKEVYALRVKGNSMIDALINDGDIVLMQHTSAVENGEMAAVWLRAEKEVTLKKVYPEPGRIRLQPANSTMQLLYTDTDNAEVQGRVISVIRQLV
jgi:repressor LexA